MTGLASRLSGSLPTIREDLPRQRFELSQIPAVSKPKAPWSYRLFDGPTDVESLLVVSNGGRSYSWLLPKDVNRLFSAKGPTTPWPAKRMDDLDQDRLKRLTETLPVLGEGSLSIHESSGRRLFGTFHGNKDTTFELNRGRDGWSIMPRKSPKALTKDDFSGAIGGLHQKEGGWNDLSESTRIRLGMLAAIAPLLPIFAFANRSLEKDIVKTPKLTDRKDIRQLLTDMGVGQVPFTQSGAEEAEIGYHTPLSARISGALSPLYKEEVLDSMRQEGDSRTYGESASRHGVVTASPFYQRRALLAEAAARAQIRNSSRFNPSRINQHLIVPITDTVGSLTAMVGSGLAGAGLTENIKNPLARMAIGGLTGGALGAILDIPEAVGEVDIHRRADKYLKKHAPPDELNAHRKVLKRDLALNLMPNFVLPIVAGAGSALALGGQKGATWADNALYPIYTPPGGNPLIGAGIMAATGGLGGWWMDRKLKRQAREEGFEDTTSGWKRPLMGAGAGVALNLLSNWGLGQWSDKPPVPPQGSDPFPQASLRTHRGPPAGYARFGMPKPTPNYVSDPSNWMEDGMEQALGISSENKKGGSLKTARQSTKPETIVGLLAATIPAAILSSRASKKMKEAMLETPKITMDQGRKLMDQMGLKEVPLIPNTMGGMSGGYWGGTLRQR